MALLKAWATPSSTTWAMASPSPTAGTRALPDTDQNTVAGNYIGLQPDGGKGVYGGNGGDGMYVTGTNTIIGGNANTFRNVISDNGGNGVNIVGGQGTILLGNFIGTNALGSDIYDTNGQLTSNTSNGVRITSTAVTQAKNNEVGQAAGAPNIIANNGEDGVSIGGPATNRPSFNSVTNNIIGADVSGKNAMTNDGNAVSVVGATFTDIDGNTLFYAKGKQAIFAQNTDNTELKGTNTTKLAGTPGAGLPAGVEFVDSTNVTIGGSNPGDGNVFDTGVAIEDSSAVTLQGNDIGVDQSGTSFNNQGDGISIDAMSSNVTIGGTASGAGNTIADNGNDGVEVYGTSVAIAGNTVTGNGTDVLIHYLGSANLSQNQALGSLVVAGAASFDGTSTVGSITVSGGSLTLDSSSTSVTVSGNYSQSGGSTTLSAGSLLAVLGTIQEQGQLNLNAASLRANGGLQLSMGAILSGAGTISANVTNAATLNLGGDLHIAGSYTQTSTGWLATSIDSAGVCDQLLVDGAANLDGTLSVTMPSSYTPPAGQTFDLISAGSLDGTFAFLSLPSYSGGYFQPLYGPTTFSLLATSNQGGGGMPPP
jgi:hypothetical protein